MKIWICIAMVAVSGGVLLNHQSGDIERLRVENFILGTRVESLSELRDRLATLPTDEIDMEKLEALRAEVPELMRLRSEVGEVRSIKPANRGEMIERLSELKRALVDLRRQEVKTERIAFGVRNQRRIQDLGWSLCLVVDVLVENGITSVPTTLDGIERMADRIEGLPVPREWELWHSSVADLRKANEGGEIGVDHFEILPRVALAGSAQSSTVTVLIREREPRLLWNDGWARYYGLSDPAQPNRLSLSDKQISKEEYRALAEEILGTRVEEATLNSMDPKEIFSRWEMKQAW